jgi:preprotein translocase subunit SecF
VSPPPEKNRPDRQGNGDGPLGEDELAEDEPADDELDGDRDIAGGGVGTGGPEKRPNVLVRLYRGETSFDFIGKRKWWFAISAIIILAGVISIGTRGLNLGIDFKGGQSWTVSNTQLTVAEATTVAENAGVNQPTVVLLTNQLSHTKSVQLQADLNSKTLSERQAIEQKVESGLANAAHISVNDVSFSDVGATWGGQVTSKAIEALIVFFIAVVLYISLRFEFKMAVAALVAVIHDLLITVGVYSLTGLQVTPDTVIAVLTVLGYSLYDTVVVFDRIADNAKGLGASGRITYSQTVNLSMNQTLARSINTSLVAIVPVLSVLVVGSLLLGATTLEDFGLALVIGLTSGAYSSIFIASPLLAIMKEREPRYVTIRQRLETRGDRLGVLTPSSVAAMTTAGVGRTGGRGRPQASGVIRPGASRSPARQPAGTGAARQGASKGAPVANRSGPGASSGAGTNRPPGTRPPPRPRKGKGKGSKGKRR